MSDEVSTATAVQEQSTPTVADLLRQGYQEAQQAREPKDIVLHGYGEPVSELHVTFRCLDDYEEVRDALREALKKQGLKPAQRELAAGIETLALAATDSYALINGERHELGLPLGLALYDHLFPATDGSARPMNDAQAITMLFHSKTMPIMTAYAELDQWIRRGGRDAEEETLGN